MKRSYEWTYLYAAVEPTTGESFCLYLPGMDDGCLEVFLEELSEAYPENHLLVVLDGAPSHRSEKIDHPENVSLLELPPYSPELDPAERWFQEFRRELSNKTFESVALIQEALTRTLSPYWEEPSLLKRLTGYPWWVEAVEVVMTSIDRNGITTAAWVAAYYGQRGRGQALFDEHPLLTAAPGLHYTTPPPPGPENDFTTGTPRS